MDSSSMDYKSVVLKCIDAGLSALGEVSKYVVYSYLAKNHLSRETIPDEPLQFTEALKSLFGRGEELLERNIVSELKQAFGIVTNNVGLVEILAAVRLPRGSSANSTAGPDGVGNPKPARSTARGKVGGSSRP